LTAQLDARDESLAEFIALVVLPVPFATLEAELWLGATWSAAVRDASLSLRVSLDIVGFTVTLAVDINRTRLDRALIHLAPDISSLGLGIVLATQRLEAGIRWATDH
jgi:hypothetical protein